MARLYRSRINHRLGQVQLYIPNYISSDDAFALHTQHRHAQHASTRPDMRPIPARVCILFLFANIVLCEFEKPYLDAGLDEVTYTCTLDPKVTADTIALHANDVQEMWGYACGRNRGIFVLDPPDGHTYGRL
jgi:hypothetical protein